MKRSKWFYNSIRSIVIIQFLLSLVFPVGALAAIVNFKPAQDQSLVQQPTRLTASSPLAPAEAILKVEILSSPLLVVDSNGGAIQPRVYVVEAKVTNIGGTDATDVIVTLDYENLPDWMLVPGEDASRQVGTLHPGEPNAYYAYWFATYPSTVGSSYQYTVTAVGSNTGAAEITSFTATTESVVSAANSGITQVGFEVTVGVEFRVDIDYKLSNNAHTAHFSPVGNADFDPSAYRLLSSDITFSDAANNPVGFFPDRVYIGPNQIPASAVNARVTFWFIALQATNTRLCSYAMIGYNAGYKYDINYCDSTAGGVVNINGTIKLDFKKVANKLTVEQNQAIDYTLYYTNTGDAPLKFTWYWDAYNNALVSANPASYNPGTNPTYTNDGRAVWYKENVPVGDKGSMSFSVLVDGNNTDIPDQTAVVNRGYFGVTPGELPASPALTSTVTTIVQAPTITFTKDDLKSSIVAGTSGTYTLTLTNTGHASATHVKVVDTLPAYVTASTANPPADNFNGQVLTWNDLGPIAPGGSVTVKVPYTVAVITPNATVLTNQAVLTYENTAGHIFAQKTATDNTTVNNAVMSISKSSAPNPVLRFHTLTYTLAYQNTGTAQATNVVISDTLPTGVTFKPNSCTPACSYDSVNKVVTFTIGTVNPGPKAYATFVVDVGDFNKGDIITNSVYGLTSDQSGKVTGPANETTVLWDAAIFKVRTFVDENGNGDYEVGEALLPNVEITATESVTPSQFTNLLGEVTVRVETSNIVTIEAAEPAGYTHATPGFLTTDVVLGTTTYVNFGYLSTINPTFAVVFGTVWEDANHNKLIDNSEQGLQGVDVWSPQATAPITDTTNQFGWYTLKFVNTNPATIMEENLPGYVSTTPDVLTGIPIVLGSNNVSPYNFGDFYGVKITGKVFDDIDASGTNNSEDGLPGVTVATTMDTTLTDANGLYELYVAGQPASPVLVTETTPAGYISTVSIPGAGAVSIDLDTIQVTTPLAGTTYTGNEFGDVLLEGVVTIQGLVWDDNGAGTGGVPADGIKNGTEPGLAGATLSLSSGLSTTSAADGTFTLYAPPSTQVALTEVNPAGYLSTNAIPGDANAIKIDNDTLNILALPANTTTSGHMFGDVIPTPLAVVSGYVFDDINENGGKDGGEPIFAGVPVTLKFKTGQVITIPTDAQGKYSFVVPLNTDLLLSTTGPGGSYYPTTPETVSLKAASAGVYENNNFGYSNDQDMVVISGLVFDDRNSNGQLDFGEFGLAGVQITLDSTTSITTQSNGLIAGSFIFLVPAAVGTPVVHHLTETGHLPGYRSTTPDTLNINVMPGTFDYYAEFGDTNNVDVGSIYGIVFDDANQNGIFENGELGLSGVTISVTVGTGPGTSVITTTTKSYGQFSYGFEVASGYHTVSSEDPAKPGYHSTTPDHVNVLVELGKSYSVNFGDSLANNAMVLGTVFRDDNGDGNQDPSEPGISGVTVNLTGGQTAITNNYGWYGFVVQNNGLYKVTEVNKAGFYSTTPDEVTVNVTEARNYIVNFGDLNNNAVTVFYGTVFDDTNVNGIRDANELGLPGVTVTISNTVKVAHQTNEWGQYSFRIEDTGTYTIKETDPSGYVSTDAIPGSAAVTRLDANTFSVAVTPADFGLPFGDNLFGDAKSSDIITISGMVWLDTNPNGNKDPGENTGVAGALVSLSSGLSMVTGSDGLYSLFAPANTEVQVTVTAPPSYIATDVDPGTHATRVDYENILVDATVNGGGTSTGNNFGMALLTNNAVISGYVYNDANGNFTKDLGEAGIGNVALKLNGGTQIFSEPGTGFYRFVLDTAGVYVVEETVPAGYFATTNPEVHVEAVIGNSYTVNFGNALIGSGFGVILGVVYNDVNVNTQWDDGEPGIKGVTITLDNGGKTVTTGNFGLYSFSVTTGSHKVEETDPAGYQSSTPNIVNTTVNNGSSQQVDFGDFLPCVPVADAFEQDDSLESARPITGFGVADPHNFADDSTDWVKFEGQQLGKYTITVDAALGARADTVVEVYASDKVTRLAVNDDEQGKTDFSSKVQFLAPVNGTYYVKISNRSELTGCLTSYTVKVEGVPPTHLYLPFITNNAQFQADTAMHFGGLSLLGARAEALDVQSINAPESPEGEIHHICPDTFEVDDTWEQAKPLVLGSVIDPQRHSFDSNTALYAADKDHIKFSAAMLDSISLTLTPVENTLVKVELYDANRTLLKEGTTTLTFTFPKAGEYYLIISPTSANTAFGCNTVENPVAGYTLNIAYSPVRFIYLPVISKQP